MNKVVYFLGAGFSAPLGLPVMRDFIQKSKDMYYVDKRPGQYDYFGEVFDFLERLSVIKNFASVNLHDIEEVLSLIEMESFVSGKALEQRFVRYVTDVVNHYTPKLQYDAVRKEPWKSDWFDRCFGARRVDNLYGHFVASLLNLEVVLGGSYPNNTVKARPHPSDTEYSVVTVNYDLVVEYLVEHLDVQLGPEGIRLGVAPELHHHAVRRMEGRVIALAYAKLHGSVEGMPIVPPTWNKTGRVDVADAWGQAHRSLSEANYVRVLGYSLPVTDTYVRYLLLSGLRGAKNLKGIDVVCKDDSGDVKRRYGQLFGELPGYRFKNGDIYDYLERGHDRSNIVVREANGLASAAAWKLEALHEEFMQPATIVLPA